MQNPLLLAEYYADIHRLSDEKAHANALLIGVIYEYSKVAKLFGLPCPASIEALLNKEMFFDAMYQVNKENAANGALILNKAMYKANVELPPEYYGYERARQQAMTVFNHKSAYWKATRFLKIENWAVTSDDEKTEAHIEMHYRIYATTPEQKRAYELAKQASAIFKEMQKLLAAGGTGEANKCIFPLLTPTGEVNAQRVARV